jgi:hypothetical protein
MNEHGEWEDEASFIRRGEEAVDSVREKLLRCRRLYLMEISESAGKRAAFEILTELRIDWEKAKRLEPQPDEPWNRANQRQPDMILAAENGWTFGEWGYGEDKKAELRKALNEFLKAEGKEIINWEEEDASPSSSPATSGGPASSSRSSRAASRDQDRLGPRVRRV